jgi:hypothetical protein
MITGSRARAREPVNNEFKTSAGVCTGGVDRTEALSVALV